MSGFSRFPRFIIRCLSLTASRKVVGCKKVKHVSVPCCNTYLSTSTAAGISWEGSSSLAGLLNKLETSLKDHSVDEAWEAFGDYKNLHGFPQLQLLNRMIVLLSYSSNPHWLRKAYKLVLMILKEKPFLLQIDPLTKLALTLVRSEMPIPAATVLRIMLENGILPSAEEIWNTFFFHLVRTEIGSYLASEILVEICEYILQNGSYEARFKHRKLIRPDLTIFNLVLDSCVRYRSTLKAQKIIELMSQMGIVADANSIIILAQVYDMVGQRDDLVKLKRHIDCVSSTTLNCHYQQFYDSLLSLHFKYNDIEAAAELVFDLYKCQKLLQPSIGVSMKGNQLRKQFPIQIGSSNLRMGFQIFVEPAHLMNNFVVEASSYSGLVVSSNGKLVPSKKAFSKLINGYVRKRKVGKLSNLLVRIQKETDPDESGLISDVMDACIQLGWLETAHDILDDLESAAVPVTPLIYASLLRAYCKENMLQEAKALLKQMSKLDLFLTSSVENFTMSDVGAVYFQLLGNDANSYFCIKASTSVGKSDLAELLEIESKEFDSASHLVHELNSSIFFFCKAKMMEDALKTYKRMQQRNVSPTSQTFIHIVNGYSSLKMYREITIVWGDIKRRLEHGVLSAGRDLFECLLWNFLRGGYFERVMETINCMIKQNMHIDKWKYKREFLMLHRDLYRNLKASHAKTEAQSKRLEHVRAFRRWAGIDPK